MKEVAGACDRGDVIRVASWRAIALEPASFVALLASLVLGATMLFASVSKMRHRTAFANSLAAYTRVPVQLRGVVAVALPPAEAALGAALLLQQFPVVAGVATGILVTVLTAASIAQCGLRGTADCGCFGVAKSQPVSVILRRNAALIVLAAVIVAFSLAPTDVVGALGAGLTLAALGVLLEALVSRSMVSLPATADVPADPARRLLMRGGFALAVGTLTATFTGLRMPGQAEAACGSCGSCADQYIYLNCSEPCCALYLVRRRKNCDGSCQSCSGWWQEVFCGIPGCGC